MDKDTIAFFKKVTGIDIRTYFNMYIYFVRNSYPQIIRYYKNGGSLDKEILQQLEILEETANNITIAIDNNSYELSKYNTNIWSLVSEFSELKIKVDTIINSDKWLRSSVSIYDEATLRKSSVLKGNQTFEDITIEEGDSQGNDTWYKMKIFNNMKEEDYTAEGGNTITIYDKDRIDTRDFSITVGDLTGEKIYGTDIDNDFAFDTTENDYTILSESDTMNQHLNVMIGMAKGANPQNINKGIDKSLLTNKAAINYPAIIRQQYNVLALDQRITNMQVTDITNTSDNIAITVNVSTILDDTFNKNI